MDSFHISDSFPSDSSDNSGYHSHHSSSSCSMTAAQIIRKKRKRHRRGTNSVEDVEIDEDDVEIKVSEKVGGRSVVWKNFMKVKKIFYRRQNGERVLVKKIERAQCNYCANGFASATTNETSAMKRHLENVCKQYQGRIHLQGQQLTENANELTLIKWTEQGCREAAVKMIVMDELPFSHIEKDGFRYFCKYVIPSWNVPSRRMIVKLLLSMYKAVKVKLKNEMKGRCLCLTTDTWTSVQNINYMVVTSHFIDSSWKMHKRFLNFKVIPNHQGSSIGKLLKDCLLEWEVERILTISVDNVSSNKVVVDYVREKMLEWKSAPVLEGKFLHVRCLAHILNIIVKAGLKMVGYYVASIRNAVRYVQSSPQRLNIFKSCVEKEQVGSKKICILDVLTRWNSTYIMLSIALELRKAFDRMVEEVQSKYDSYFEEDKDIQCEDELIQDIGEASVSDGTTKARNRKGKKKVGPPQRHDWEKIAAFVKVLKIFYQVTMKISASNHPTSWRAFHDIVAIKAEVDGLIEKPETFTSLSIENTLFDMAWSMKIKYEKYFATLEDRSQLFLISLVLNPKFKIKNFEIICRYWLNMGQDEANQNSSEIKELLVEFCDAYNNPSSKSDRPRSGESNEVNKFSSGVMKDMEDVWEIVLEDSQENVLMHEIDKYLLDPIEKPSSRDLFNILEWWKINNGKYPGLDLVAKDVLAIQVSTVASESAFSTGRRVLDLIEAI